MEKLFRKYVLSKPNRTYYDKVQCILSAFAANIIWLAFIVLMLGLIYAPPEETIKAVSKGINISWRIYGDPTKFGDFFLACIFAPLWEELLFRWVPITIARKLDKSLMLPIVVASSIIFGWCHNAPINILIQGVGGFLLAYVYIKNGFSYKSSVVMHFLWNFSLGYLIPIIQHG